MCGVSAEVHPYIKLPKRIATVANSKFNKMKNEDSNRVNMINATITICDANTAATAGVPSFATVLGSVKSKMVLINSLNQIGEGTTTGVTLDTNILRKAMTALALKCANATLAFANSTNNNTLAALVNFSETKLNSLKKEDVDDVCETIHDATNTNIAGATNFGASATDVTDLQAAVDLYRTASQNPRQAIISKSQAKKQVANMVREVIDDLLVKQMDKMVNTLKVANKDFFDTYKQGREIIDLGTTSAKIRGTVLDEDDVPLKGVLFQIFETGTNNKVAETQTDTKGKYSAAKLPVGNFDFRWSKDGYEQVNETNVHISAGKELRRKIVMMKEIILEGDVAMGAVVNIDLSGIEGDIETDLSITVSGATLRFYGSSAPNAMPMGVFLEVAANTSIDKTAEQFISQTGLGDVNSFLNVQNVGGVNGHYKIVIVHLT